MSENEYKSEFLARCSIPGECELILRREWNGSSWNYVVVEIPENGEMKAYFFGNIRLAVSVFKEIIHDCVVK